MVIKAAVKLIRTFFPRTIIIPSIGNVDFFPAYNFTVGHTGKVKKSPNFLRVAEIRSKIAHRDSRR